MSVQVVLSGFVDNDASGDVTLGDRLDFTTTATNTGNVPLTNVHIVDSFDATGHVCTVVPPFTGNTCQLTSSHVVDDADVTAGIVTDSATVTSSELPPQSANSGSTVSNPPALTVASGNNQVVAVGTPSAPLVVLLTNNDLPVANAVITWSASAGTLAHPTSTTDASGHASNTLTLQHPGTATVSATSASPAAGPATFVINGGLADSPGLTPAEAGVANALDHACPALAHRTSLTPAEQDLLAQCQAIAAAAGSGNPGHLPDVLDQLLPHDALLQTASSVIVTTAQFDNVKSRLAALRSGTNGDHFGGLAMSTPHGSLPIGSLGEALLGIDDKDGKKEVGGAFERWGFFASGSFGRGDSDVRAATPGYSFQTHGLTAGVDYRYNDHLVFGMSAGYSNYSSEVDFGGGMRTHGWSLSAYSTLFKQDSWYMDAVLSYGRTQYDIDRRVAFAIHTAGVDEVVNQLAKSSSDGRTFAGALTFGRDFAKGGLSWGPYMRAQFSRTDFDRYRETLLGGPGSGLGLSVASRSASSLQSVVGGKVNYAVSTRWGVVMPHAELEWLHEFRDNPDQINATFLADPTGTPFALVGDKIDADFFKFGTGMSFVFPHGKSGFFYIERTLGLSGVKQTNLSLGFRAEF